MWHQEAGHYPIDGDKSARAGKLLIRQGRASPFPPVRTPSPAFPPATLFPSLFNPGAPSCDNTMLTLMEKERLNRLSHWWREVETASDEDALRRKLHLMEAEIRNTLRGARAARLRQGLRNLYAAGMLGAILLLTLGVQHMTAPVSAPQYAAGIPTAAEPPAAAVSVPAPATGLNAVMPTAPAKPALDTTTSARPHTARAASRHTTAESRRPAVALASAKPALAAHDPAPAVPAASVAPQPKAAAAKADPGLDPLALLSKLESEFEK
jgi:hypothetical protein